MPRKRKTSKNRRSNEHRRNHHRRHRRRRHSRESTPSQSRSEAMAWGIRGAAFQEIMDAIKKFCSPAFNVRVRSRAGKEIDLDHMIKSFHRMGESILQILVRKSYSHV